MAEALATRVTKSVCPYCGVGCGVLIEHDRARIANVTGDPEHPANFGRLCTKGASLHLTGGVYGRALHPERRAARQAPRTRASWDDTLAFLARRYAEVIGRHGPDAVGFYISGQLLTEEYYVFNKLAKGLIGTNNIDTNSRLCMSSAVAAYKATLGADAPPTCYADIDHAELIVIAGSNTAYAHPVVYRRIEAARARRPPPRLIVIDPRRTETAAEADLHLPILPGTDVALFNGLLHVLLWEGRVDHPYIAAHTEGFDAVKAMVRDYHPRMVAEICGIAEAALLEAARWFGESRATLSLYCQGLNQSSHGTAKNAALINLHLATGQIGRPGAGPFSLTGQPNAMGGREVGGMANLLPGHRDLADPAHRAEVAALWGVSDVPAAPGKTAVEMFEAVRAGEIKLLWIACTNPALSLPDQAQVRAALAAAELVVVQEAYADTETAAFADVLLPAATWGEKEGTITNSERRITHVRAAIPAPAEARPDWAIAVEFARRLEARLRPGRTTLFPYRSPEEIFNEHRETTRGRDLDITGLSYALLDESGPQQWPHRAGEAAGSARLYRDGRYPTPSGRASFYAAPYRRVAEATDARYPLSLNTGRLRDQWHGMTRTGRLARLFNHAAEPTLAMNPRDLARRQLASGDLVRVRSRRGELVLRAEASDELRSGQVFLPMHWGSRFLRGLGINALTIAACDPDSGQPELKACGVQVERAALPWRLVAMGSGEPGESQLALRRLAALRACLGAFDYASCGGFGRAREGVILRAAHSAAPAPEVLAAIDASLGLAEDGQVMSYSDPRRGIARRMRILDGRLTAVRLSGDILGHEWLQEWLDAGHPVAGLGARLLAPHAAPPVGAVIGDRVICACRNVSKAEILSALARCETSGAAAIVTVQATLKCGTVCGSCGPELRRLAAAHVPAGVGGSGDGG